MVNRVLINISSTPPSIIDADVSIKNCTRAALEEFPNVGPLSQPWSLIVPSLIVIYSVLLLAKVVDQHFIPSIKIICYGVGMGSDVAGATLMAAGASSPDLFINLVGTFLTEGDIGIGTVLGCGVINTLLVPALCVLLTSTQEIRLRYWAVTRDSVFYCITISLLVGSLHDGMITVAESGSMVALYLLYLLILFKNNWLKLKFENSYLRFRSRSSSTNQRMPLLMKPVASVPYGMVDLDESEETPNFRQRFFVFPERSSTIHKFLFIVGWPLELALYLTMPSLSSRCTKFTNGLTVCACLIWIGTTSYLVSWMITIIGYELGVPDSLMGLTLLAIGMSVPESLTSIIVARQGHGSMAIGNAFGSNIFDILACLGLPWLIKSSMFSDQGWVYINSRGLSLSTGLLLAFLSLFYIALAVNTFHLTIKIGVMCIILYSIFVVLSSLTEMNVFFVGNLPSCSMPG